MKYVKNGVIKNKNTMLNIHPIKSPHPFILGAQSSTGTGVVDAQTTPIIPKIKRKTYVVKYNLIFFLKLSQYKKHKAKRKTKRKKKIKFLILTI